MSRSVSVGPPICGPHPEPIQRRGGGCGAACIRLTGIHGEASAEVAQAYVRGEGICGTWASSPGPLVDFSMSCESPIPNSAQPSTKQLLPASGATRVSHTNLWLAAGSGGGTACPRHTPRLTVVEATFGWSDLGSWTDVHDARVAEGDVDADGNVLEDLCPSLQRTAAR